MFWLEQGFTVFLFDEILYFPLECWSEIISSYLVLMGHLLESFGCLTYVCKFNHFILNKSLIMEQCFWGIHQLIDRLDHNDIIITVKINAVRKDGAEGFGVRIWAGGVGANPTLAHLLSILYRSFMLT